MYQPSFRQGKVPASILQALYSHIPDPTINKNTTDLFLLKVFFLVCVYERLCL